MKRIWLAAALFVLSIIVCSLGINNTQKVTAQMMQTVSMAKNAQEKGDAKAAYRLSEKALSDWHCVHRTLCTYMVHSRLESIDQTLSILPELCQNGAKDSFLSECDRSIIQISYLKESEIPNLDNIF